MELWEYFKGLEYEHTVEDFRRKNWPLISLREDQYRKENGKLLSGSCATDSAIRKYLSSFEKEYYHDINRIAMYRAVELHLIQQGGKLIQTDGKLYEFIRVNRDELNRLYTSFRNMHALVHTLTLADIFKAAITNYREFIKYCKNT